MKYSYSGETYYPTIHGVALLVLGENIKNIDLQFPDANVVINHAPTPPALRGNIFPQCEYGLNGIIVVDSPEIEKKYLSTQYWEDYLFSNMANVAEVNVSTPGDLSVDLIMECGMSPIKVVSLKVNGEINAKDFDQMRVNMASLMSLDLSDASISTIPEGALRDKLALNSLILPTVCETIGANAFNGCIGITSIEFPASVKTINESAFVGTSLSSVTFNEGLQTIGRNAFAGCQITSVDLKEGLQTVGQGAFAGCPLTSLSLPYGLLTIGDRAFEGTSLAQRLNLPQTLKSIGYRAFAGQPLSGHLTIPETVTTVGAEAFAGTDIATVFISGAMTQLAEGIFAGCPNLDVVYVPDNITEIGTGAFRGCASLYDLRLSQQLTSIGGSALRGTPLPWVIIPEGVEEISSYVMADCADLASVSLPSTTTHLAEGALYGDRALRNLTVKAIVPPTVENASVFRYVNTEKCVISIPSDSYREYVLSEFWGRFVQMRNNIAVETVGNGEITFDAVEEEENESPAETRRRARALAPSRSVSAVAPAENGSTLYIPQNGTVNFYIKPAEGGNIVSATLDGIDIIGDIHNGVFTTTAANRSGKLIVNFSYVLTSVDTVNTTDFDGEAVYYNLQGVRVDNPGAGIYIRRQGTKVDKVVIR